MLIKLAQHCACGMWAAGCRCSQPILPAPAAGGSAQPEAKRDKSKSSMNDLFLGIDLSKPWGPRSSGGLPESEPTAAMSDTKLGVEVKGEGARVEGTQPRCQVLGNFKPKALNQGQVTMPKITSQESFN